MVGKGSSSPPPSPSEQPPLPPDRNKDIRKSLTFSGGGGMRETRRNDSNISLVRGVQQPLEVKHTPSPDHTAPSQQVNLFRLYLYTMC